MSRRAAAAAASSSAASALSGIDIGRIMSSKGPIVKCVLLRAAPAGASSERRAGDDGGDANDEEKADGEGAEAGGGEAKEVSAMSIKEIKRELESRGVDASTFVEKPELMKALEGARAAAGDDEKAAGRDGGDGEVKVVSQDDEAPKVVPLQHLIEEIELDTTPRKSMVSKTLGGDFTFLGQYEEEGTVVMIRRPDWEDEEEDEGDDSNDIPPINPHALQPPLHDVEVRGDILMLRVAETEEELDDSAEAKEEGEESEKKHEAEGDDSGDEAKSATTEDVAPTAPAIRVPTNDEFFLDYTREEYLKFAARTDIVAEEAESSSDEESEGEDAEPSAAGAVAALANDDDEDDEDDKDDDFDPEDSDGDDDEEERQVGMMNMILGHMLRKFREENGRGPDSLELLEMRKALADRLGVEVPPVDEEACDWTGKSPKATTRAKGEGKRVVVAEERNETEEIPRRENASDDDVDSDEDVEDVSVNLKRPAQDMADDGDGEQASKKRAKLDGENNGDNSCNDGATKNDDES
mmetsp:Transcript_48559/g.103329  ORF Transcript_48559/g.103329 Transcript_48559/m.103329 type:complete len:524 (-) Transcript_48559:8-1579(-)